MSYESQGDLAKDKGFQDRVTMCVAEQAQIFVADDRPEYQQLAYQAIGALDATANQFIPLVATGPGMTVDSTDGDILAAVQHVWPTVGARYIPAPPPVIPDMMEPI
jgi:hypothetical protein